MPHKFIKVNASEAMWSWAIQWASSPLGAIEATDSKDAEVDSVRKSKLLNNRHANAITHKLVLITKVT